MVGIMKFVLQLLKEIQIGITPEMVKAAWGKPKMLIEQHLQVLLMNNGFMVMYLMVVTYILKDPIKVQ